MMQYIQRALRNISGHRFGRFPGAHPITFTRRRLSYLRKHAYMVAEKTDGIRFLLYASAKSGVFLINRSFLFVCCSVQMDLPGESVLDGEIIYENNRYVFYVFDALCYDGVVVTQLPLMDRLRVVHQFVKRVHPNNFMQIKSKPMYALNATSHVFTHVIPSLSHVSDGLIFTPCMQPYEPKIPILKWKPAFLNSVDFLIRDGKCYVNDRKEPVADIDERRTLVGECVWRDDKWVLERVREDKRTGNSFRVYQDIQQDLQQPLTARLLVDYITHLPNTAP